MVNRKAQAIVFNWIYVAIVGAIILLLFTGFAVKQGIFSGKLLNLKVRDNIDNVLSSYRSPYVEHKITLPGDFMLSFKDGKFRVDDGDYNMIYNKLLAMPYTLKGKQIAKNKYEFFILTYPVELPYFIDNIIIFGSEDYSYDFSYDSQKIKDYIEGDISDFISEGDDKKIRFTQGSCSQTSYDEEIEIGYKIDNEDIYGYICGNGWKRPFIGRSMLYSAMFSGDFEFLFSLIQKRTALVSSNYLRIIAQYEKTCPSAYNEMKSELAKIKNFNQNSNPEDILRAVRRIEQINSKLSRRCPSIY